MIRIKFNINDKRRDFSNEKYNRYMYMNYIQEYSKYYAYMRRIPM